MKSWICSNCAWALRAACSVTIIGEPPWCGPRRTVLPDVLHQGGPSCHDILLQVLVGQQNPGEGAGGCPLLPPGDPPPAPPAVPPPPRGGGPASARNPATARGSASRSRRGT